MVSTMASIVFLSVTNGLLGFVGTVVNSLVVFVVYKNRELQSELNLLIASLSVADLIVCVVAQPMYIFYLNHQGEGKFKDVFELTALIGLHASFNSLTGITLNRMAVLLHPFSYTLSHHKKRLYTSIVVGVWCSSIGLGYFFATRTGKLIQPYVHTFMFSLFIVCYGCIFWVAGKQVRKISLQAQSVSYNHKAAKLKSENNAAKTSAMLVSLTLACFFPDIIFDYMRIVDEMRFSWSFTLMFVASSLNPCIYVWRNEHFRRSLLRTIHCLPSLRNQFSSNQVNPIPVSLRHTIRSRGHASTIPVQDSFNIENLE